MKSENELPPRRPHLAIAISEAFPSGFEDDLVAELAANGVTAGGFRVPSGPFAGLELYLPTAAMFFVAASYFTGVFQKMGADHYEVVKRVAKKLYARMALVCVTPIGTLGKLVGNQKYSLAYSITGELMPRLSFKFIIATKISEEEAEHGISAFLDLIRDIHCGTMNPEDLEALLTHKPVGGVVLVKFDAKEGRIVSVDPRE